MTSFPGSGAGLSTPYGTVVSKRLLRIIESFLIATGRPMTVLGRALRYSNAIESRSVGRRSRLRGVSTQTSTGPAIVFSTRSRAS